MKSNGFLRKTEGHKYIAVIEERHMRKIMEGKFSVLDRIRNIVETGKVPATISIGVGRSGATFAENEKQACQALDMCLGQGRRSGRSENWRRFSVFWRDKPRY